MKKIFFLVLTISLLVSCKNNKPKNELLSPGNLKSQFFSIDATKDTAIKTIHGAVLLIPAKAFEITGGIPVAIEIKEALSSYEILMGGLTTESNGKPLSSGGMIYINATVEGKQLQLKLPINVSIPSKTIDTAMKVFKGEIQTDSSINWIKPQPLDSLILPKESPSTISTTAITDTAKPAGFLSEQLGIDYSAKTNQPNTIGKTKEKKPCGDDTVYVVKNEETQDYPIINAPSTSTNLPVTAPANKLGKPEDYEGLRDGFTDELGSSTGVYNFNIKTLGWYNIDAYVEGYAGSTYVKITAQLQVKYTAEMNVYLFCPSRKMLSVSNKNDGDKYTFDKVDGKVPLFLKDKAVLFAFGSYKDKMLYGISELIVQQEQVIEVSIKETTEEELIKILGTKNLEGIDLQVIKKEMKIIPKNCDDYPKVKNDSLKLK